MKIKIEELTQAQDCRVVLEDIKAEIQDGKFKGLKVINWKNKNASNYVNQASTSVINRNKVTCEIRQKLFYNKSSTPRHMKLIHSEGEKAIIQKHTDRNYECDFCGKKFKVKGRIYLHMNVHLQKVKCHICQVELKVRSVAQHIQEFHTIERKFNCNFCSASFKSNNQRQSHEKIHDKKFECDVCKKKYPSQGKLNTHQRRIHENEGVFNCEECGKKFNQKFYLKLHLKVHERFRPKPFQCQKCSFSSHFKTSLKYHIEAHQRQDEKFAAMKNPLKCEKCGKFFRSRQALSGHKRAVHPACPVQCDLCGKYENMKWTLRKHIEAHLKKNGQDYVRGGG